jgi:hypothetical protein
MAGTMYHLRQWRGLRRGVAIAAAYALALQAVLGSILVSQSAAAPAGGMPAMVFCLAGAEGPPAADGSPAHPYAKTHCILCTLGQAKSPDADGHSVSAPVTFTRLALAAAVDDPELPRAALCPPKLSQGPPFAG